MLEQPTDSVPNINQELEMLKALPFDDLVNTVANKMVHFAISLAIAVVVFYVGKFIICKLHNMMAGILIRRKVDRSLTTFILSLVRIVLYFILIVTVIGILGINTSSFIALFASAGVALGMALSGTLQNFAGGVLILLLKPYKVGDYIEAQGFAGYVTEIQIFSTIINTFDNKSIIIPNGGLSTGSILNWSREEYRRVEWAISISYNDNVDDARKAILDMFAADNRIVSKNFDDDRRQRLQEMKLNATAAPAVEEPEKKGWIARMFTKRRNKIQQRLDRLHAEQEANANITPASTADRTPVVVVDKLADSSVDIIARAWVHTSNYWEVYYQYNERFYNELPKHGIHFPFPQLTVTLNK